MNIAALLAIPALVSPAPNQKPPLPSPTPGLSEQGQIINYNALTDGVLLKTFEVDGATYKIRAIQNIIILYNSKDHVLVIAQSSEDRIHYASGAYDGDPYPQGGKEAKVVMDGVLYTMKLIQDTDGLVVACYNSRGHIVFAMGNPKAVLLPETADLS